MNGRQWTDLERAMLHELYPNSRTADLAKKLNRDVSAIYRASYALGLKKSAAYLATPAAGRTTGKQGMRTRFVKGHQTWNKDQHFVAGGRSAETRFKKGQKPHSWKPIGSERLSKEGYLQRKITDTGYTPRDWIGVHIIVWTQHNGPIPDGHAVAFKDGNKNRIVIDNLELVSRRELMMRNTVQNLPEDLKEVIRLNGVIRRKINGN